MLCVCCYLSQLIQAFEEKMIGSKHAKDFNLLTFVTAVVNSGHTLSLSELCY